jgi:GNAT superfamily N-acetyltransferase
MRRIDLARSETEIERCFPVMVELRPHLWRGEFVGRVRRQQKDGYQLAFLEEEGRVVSVAGFRMSERLVSGKILYVDDLVTAESERSKGYGEALFDWLVACARASGCEVLELDSGVQRFGAHRFYLRKRMDISSHHFRLKL